MINNRTIRIGKVARLLYTNEPLDIDCLLVYLEDFDDTTRMDLSDTYLPDKILHYIIKQGIGNVEVIIKDFILLCNIANIELGKNPYLRGLLPFCSNIDATDIVYKYELYHMVSRQLVRKIYHKMKYSHDKSSKLYTTLREVVDLFELDCDDIMHV